MTSQTRDDVRPSPLAGQWYQGAAARLAEGVDAYIAQAATPPIPGSPVALLAPHAGHRYCGPVAGHAFKGVQGRHVDVVAVVGPSHYRFDAPLVTSGHNAYETPLGRVPVDRDAVGQLCERLPYQIVRRDPEHAIEIELPFLQRALVGGFALIPIMLVDQSIEMAQALGSALVDVVRGRSALLVASSDLSHFYAQSVAESLDRALLAAVRAFDPARVIETEEKGEGFACGRGAIASVMIAAKALGADCAEVVAYATSGDITGDTDRVVGYGAAVFYKAARP